MQAPEKVGRYTAYFRMVSGFGVRFGHKVWCDIRVEEPVKEEPVSAFQREDTVKMMAQEPIKEVAQPSLIEKSAALLAEDEEDELAMSVVIHEVVEVVEVVEEAGDKQMDGSQIMNDSEVIKKFLTPKEIYEGKCADLGFTCLKDSYKTLWDFGFVDFEENKKLMAEYKNDVEKVAAVLCEKLMEKSLV